MAPYADIFHAAGNWINRSTHPYRSDQQHIPVLRKLVIFVLDWDMNQTPFAPLHNAPNLHDLRLVTPLVSPARIGAASVHLTFLEIYSRVTLAECLDILSHFPNLLHLSVPQVRPTEQDRGLLPTPPISPPPFTLAKTFHLPTGVHIPPAFASIDG